MGIELVDPEILRALAAKRTAGVQVEHALAEHAGRGHGGEDEGEAAGGAKHQRRMVPRRRVAREWH